MNAPNFIIHATGALGTMPDLGKRPYRLKCRFRVPAGSGPDFLEKAKYAAAEQFIADMKVKGWEYIGGSSRLPPEARGFRLTFKGAHVEVRGLSKPKRLPSSREMLPAIMQGARFLPDERSDVVTVPHYTETEYLDWELAGVFLRNTLLMEVPDAHEERRPT